MPLIPRFFLLFGTLLLASFSRAQEVPVYKKNSISIDLTQCGTNELNLSYEHFFSVRRSLEFTAGLVYVNQPFAEFGRSWTISHYFEEHGFSARATYKLYKQQVEDSKWRDYIAPGIIYKYLYFNNQWFENETEKVDSNNVKITEAIYQHRFRHKFGIEITWGKIYEMSKALSFELYYGVGLRATVASRTDIYKQDVSGVSPAYPTNYGTDNSFYVRPTLKGGVKFRFSF